MDFDEAKENIQPLTKGRNVNILYDFLKEDAGKQLSIHRLQLEKDIHDYCGDDPLSVWYNYIYWIEQSYPALGKESGLSEVLTKCLTHFQSDERYYQDQRMVKLFIKLIDKNKNPAECYHHLYEAGIGTMVADFYIAWAYCYDMLGNFRKADQIFRRGIACRAQPLEVLKEAHQHFGFVVAQRIMYKDDSSVETEYIGQLNERRKALTLLRSHNEKLVGSTRTGAAIKESLPGIFKTTLMKHNNHKMKVFADENVPPQDEKFGVATSAEAADFEKSVIEKIIESNKENEREPGPWNKAYKPSTTQNLFNKSNVEKELDFKILEDSFHVTHSKYFQKTTKHSIDIRFDKTFIYPPNHVAKNLPQKEWVTPITSELMPCGQTIAQYNKCMVYPRSNVEFQLEEYGCYVWLKKHNIENNFTKKREKFWSNGPNYNVRQYPHFAKQSNKQCLDSLDQPFVPIKLPGLVIAFDAVYNTVDKEERQFEEIMALKLKCNETIVKAIDMEETVCSVNGAKFMRKSFLPMRQSIAPMKPNKQKTLPTLPMLAEFEFESKNLQIGNENPKPQQEVEQKRLTDTCSINSDAINFSLKNSDQIQIPSFPVRDNELITASPDRGINLEICKRNAEIQGECENNFKFKTPLLPPKGDIDSAKNNLPFEIFEDSIASKSLHPINSKMNSNDQNKTANFDGDETCSTHIFNKFLKVQSVSTPKLPNKSSIQSVSAALVQKSDATSKNENCQLNSHHQHQAVAILDSKSNTNTNSPSSIDANENANSSLPRKLSTILENSEHGTTPSTHTTGTTTKSTISSPENELEAKCAPQISSQKTIKQQSVNRSAANIDASKEINQSDSNSALHTPSVARLNCKSLRPFNFSIFEEPLMDVIPKNVGNFSRLDEHEDTSTEKLMKPPYFQEDDETESLSKLFLASPPDVGKFVEDKTDIIPAFLVKSDRKKQLEADHSITISKPSLLAPLAANKIGNFAIDGSERTPAIIITPDPSEFEKCKDTDVLLDFFAKSPRKMAMTSRTREQEDYQTNQDGRSIIQSTYNTEKRNQFHVDLNPNSNSRNMLQQQPLKQCSLKSKDFVRNDSFLPEFSLHEAVAQTINSGKVNEISKNNYSTETKLFEVECFSNRKYDGGTIEKNYLRKAFGKTEKIQEDISDASVGKLETQHACHDGSFSGHAVEQTESDSKRKIPFVQAQTSQSTTSVHSDANALNHILMDTFVKDFTNIACKGATATARATAKLSSSNADATCRKFNNSSDINKSSIVQSIIKSNNNNNNDNSNFESHTHTHTNTFNSNLSKIKNSTSLPNYEPEMQNANANHSNSNQHLLTYSYNDTLEVNNHNTNRVPTKLNFLSNIQKADGAQNYATDARTVCAHLSSAADSVGHDTLRSTLKNTASGCNMMLDAENVEVERSMNYELNEHKSNAKYQSWGGEEEEDHQHRAPKDNKYIHAEYDLNQTQQLINNLRVDPNINPFNADLINAFLENINFTNYIENLPNCELVGRVARLCPKSVICVHDVKFEIFKMIDNGAYGNIYSGKDLASNKKYAFKQECPANFWEYYICLEIQDRVNIDEMLPAFMSVDYAIIGNNAGILITSLSEYGSIINVCNKIKAQTLKNIDEYIVMLLTCELLQIIDHLHAVNIIHADIKADNFLLINRLSYPNVDSQRYMKLIDFGVSIDMKLFNHNQTFTYVHKDKSIRCVEMREGRPWAYQLDLYGLASVIHVLLFGKYMDVEKKSSNGIWMPKIHMPRYCNRTLWETIFKNLLNIPDCQVMPNLQQLRALLQEEMEEKRAHLIRMISEFNRALLN